MEDLDDSNLSDNEPIKPVSTTKKQILLLGRLQ